MNDKYQELKDLIENAEFVDFAPYGDGVSEPLITRAEDFFGFKLPDSYKWWLRNYSGGMIASEEIYSLYGSGLDEGFSGGDICHMHKVNTANARAGEENRLFIAEGPGTDECFYFKVEPDKNEWLVYRADAGLNDEYVYAESFVEFLIKRINEWFD